MSSNSNNNNGSVVGTSTLFDIVVDSQYGQQQQQRGLPRGYVMMEEGGRDGGGGGDSEQEKEFYRDYYDSIKLKFPTCDKGRICREMLYIGMIDGLEVDQIRGMKRPVYWIPKSHRIAIILLYNRGDMSEPCNIMECSLNGLQVISCECKFIDSIVDYVWERIQEVMKEEKIYHSQSLGIGNEEAESTSLVNQSGIENENEEDKKDSGGGGGIFALDSVLKEDSEEN